MNDCRFGVSPVIYPDPDPRSLRSLGICDKQLPMFGHVQPKFLSDILYLNIIVDVAFLL